MKPLSPKYKHICKIIICALALLATVCVVALTGRYALFPGALSVKVSGVCKEGRSPNGTAVIDKSSQRVLILDADGNCRETLKAKIESHGATYFYTTAVCRDKIYIGEFTRKENSAYLDSERIVVYDFDGKKLGIALELKHGEENRTLVPVIQDIVVINGKGTAACVDSLHRKVYLMTFSPECDVENVDIQPFSVPLEYPIAAYFAQSGPETLIVRDKQNDFCKVQLRTNAAEIIENTADVSTDPIIAADCGEGGDLSFTLQSSLEGATIHFCVKRQAIQILFWVCCAWLTICVLCIIVINLSKFWRQRKYRTIKRIAEAVIAVGICVLITSFYSFQVFKNHEQNVYGILKALSALTYTARPNLINECLQDYLDDGKADSARIREVEEYFESSVHVLNQLGRGSKFSLIAHNDNGENYILCDSSTSTLVGEKVSTDTSWVSNVKTDENGLTYFNSRFSRLIVCGYPILDKHGKICGLLVAYHDMGIYAASLKKDFFDRTILLLSILILVGFVVTEGKACAASFAERRRMRAKGIPHDEVAMARPIMFLSLMASSVNSTLLVVIIKEMLENTQFAKNDILISLPFTVFTLGYTFGAPLRKFLMKRMPLKLILQMSGIISAACYAVCFWSVANSKVVLFTLAIFTSNVFRSVISSFVEGLAFYSQNMRHTNTSIATAKVSGTAIAGVVSGILASRYGNASIQLFGMFAAMATFAFIAFVIPKDLYENDAKENVTANVNSAGSSIRKLLADPIMLCVIAYMSVSITLFEGYRSYLFPYVASEGGISKATISNIITFCNAVVFYSSLSIGKRKKNSGGIKTFIAASMVISSVFMLFSLNSSIQWAILALVVSAVVCKFTDPLIDTFWQERVLQTNIDKQDAQIFVHYVRKSASALRSTVLGCFMEAIGFAGACFTSGAIGAISVGAFAATYRKQSQRTEKSM